MKTLILALSLMLTVPAFARSDNGGKYSASRNGKAIQYEQARNNSNNTNPNSDRNCYYCYKDLSTEYTPSRHKYAKRQ